MFIPQALQFQQKEGINGKILLLLDNAPSHPPLEQLNRVNEKVEIVYLPPNVTAIIQPLDQGAISITKKYYKKNLLRNLLFAEKLEGADEFLKRLNYRDCFPILNEAWKTVKESTLHKIWKPLLGNSQQAENLQTNENNQQATVNCQQVDLEESIDNLEDVTLCEKVSNDVSRIFSGPNFSLENANEVLKKWYETEHNDCGWESLTDTELVNFILNGRVEVVEVLPDDENSRDSIFETEKVTSAQASEGLKTFKDFWVQQNDSSQRLQVLKYIGILESITSEE